MSLCVLKPPAQLNGIGKGVGIALADEVFFAQLFGDVLEIEHRFAKAQRYAGMYGFQRIMSAARDEAAADKGDRCARHGGAEFAECV